MKIGYHVKDDKNGEIIKSGKFSRMIDAINTFAQLKNMTPDEFFKTICSSKVRRLI